MKALFTGFLSVSISSCIIIGIVLALRFFLKKSQKWLMCALWAVVILRLLLPVQIGNPLGLRPETPVFTKTDTQFFGAADVRYEEEVPSFIPVEFKANTNEGKTVTVDYVHIFSIVWSAVVVGMLLYTLLAYIRLKLRVREAVKIKDNILECTRIDTAFLLGYFRPKVYLPYGMSKGNEELIIAHEKAHIRWGDHWFKLIGFIALALHWFNPFVWAMYVLLCQDIEDACDERVVRNLDEKGRASYSTALLSCGKDRKTLAACPLAFGEVSIRQRIINVLNYKKPTMWIAVVLTALIIVFAFLFMTDPTHKEPPYYDELCASIGQPVSVLCDKLDIRVEDLIAEGDAANTPMILPGTVNYMGTEFKVRLILNYTFNRVVVEIQDAKLHGFEYVSELPLESETQSAAAATKISKELLEQYGTPVVDSESTGMIPVASATEEKLLDLYHNEVYTNRYHTVGMAAIWSLTDQAAPEVMEYLYAYKDSADWANRFQTRARPVDTYPEFFVTFTAHRQAYEGMYIRIKYDVGVCHSSRYAPYQQKNWWDKISDWLK